MYNYNNHNTLITKYSDTCYDLIIWKESKKLEIRNI